MKVFLKDFTTSVLASLFATFLTTFLIGAVQFGESFNLKIFYELIIKYSFLLYWLFFLIILFTVRMLVKNRIRKMQTPLPTMFSIGNNHDLKYEMRSHGFKWIIFVSTQNRDYRTNEIIDIDVGRVDGPYCVKDFREMKVSETYFGMYKYKCPKCGFKRKLLKNKWTLESDVEDEFESKFRSGSMIN